MTGGNSVGGGFAPGNIFDTFQPFSWNNFKNDEQGSDTDQFRQTVIPCKMEPLVTNHQWSDLSTIPEAAWRPMMENWIFQAWIRWILLYLQAIKWTDRKIFWSMILDTEFAWYELFFLINRKNKQKFIPKKLCGGVIFFVPGDLASRDGWLWIDCLW